MSIERVRAYFKELGREGDILEFPVSSATVELAAQAVGVIPARIAKTLSFLVDGKCVLIVAAGDAKVDNSKYKGLFHTKAKMLTPEQAAWAVFFSLTTSSARPLIPTSTDIILSSPLWGNFYSVILLHVPGKIQP